MSAQFLLKLCNLENEHYSKGGRRKLSILSMKIYIHGKYLKISCKNEYKDLYVQITLSKRDHINSPV